MSLSDLGWSPFFSDAFDRLAGDGVIPARVIRQDRQRYLVEGGTGVCVALLPGHLLYADPEAAPPAVGDWVAAEPLADGQAVIRAVLPRFSAFSRKEAGGVAREQVLAANVDLVFLVSGLDRDFNLRRIERYVVQARGSGARPVVLLNKADLCADVGASVEAVARVAVGVEALVLSARTGDGLARLRALIEPGRTAVFLGSSGVGKSTLVNGLLGGAYQETGAVRAGDGRGRHTTTHRELLRLPGGGLVIDMPGLRELQLWSDAADLEGAFADVEALAAACRFRDCTHGAEPGCAVREALHAGRLDPGRFESYEKLRRELRFLDQRRQDGAGYAARQREKQFGKLVRRINRHNPKRR